MQRICTYKEHGLFNKCIPHNLQKKINLLSMSMVIFLNDCILDHEVSLNKFQKADTLQVMGFPGGSDGKASACNEGDLGSIPVSQRSPGKRNGNPLQYFCLENYMDRGAWQATVYGVTKSRTCLSDFTFAGYIPNLSVKKKRFKRIIFQAKSLFSCQKNTKFSTILGSNE